MEEATIDSPDLRLDGNDQINEADDGNSCANCNDTETELSIPHGECTPQQASATRQIDNTIFNTISKIVNPAAKVRELSTIYLLPLRPLCTLSLYVVFNL